MKAPWSFPPAFSTSAPMTEVRSIGLSTIPLMPAFEYETYEMYNGMFLSVEVTATIMRSSKRGSETRARHCLPTAWSCLEKVEYGLRHVQLAACVDYSRPRKAARTVSQTYPFGTQL